MKIREGHVSNSSSQSFVLIITKDDLKRVRKEYRPKISDLEKEELKGRDLTDPYRFFEDQENRLIGDYPVLFCRGEDYLDSDKIKELLEVLDRVVPQRYFFSHPEE